MPYVAGMRSRLIRDSFTRMMYDALDGLDWFDPAAQHLPIQFLYEPVDYQVELKPNVVAIGDDDMESTEWEMGSLLAEHRWLLFIDIYAESSSLGIHLSHDIKAILEGRFPSIGRNDPSFAVYDWTQATPSQIFTCQIENVELNRGQSFSRPWERYWYMISLEVCDYYENEDG